MRRSSIPSKPSQVIDNSTDFASGPTPSTKEFTKTGCGSSTSTASSTIFDVTTPKTDVDSSINGNALIENRIRKSSDISASDIAPADAIPANWKSYIEPQSAELCCATSMTPTRSHLTEELNDNTAMISTITSDIVPITTSRNYRPVETLKVDISVNETHSEEYTDSSISNDNNSLLSTVLLNYESVSTTSNTVWTNTDSTDDLPHNRTFNFVFRGNCRALKRRGPEAVQRFRLVVVDALSSGLAVSTKRLIAGEPRCGSLNLSVTLLNAGDADVQWMMSTLAAATLRVSVEDVDETFVLSRVESIPLPTVEVPITRVIAGHTATTTATTQPHLSQGSVAILVVFIIIGALAVLAGTVSAAIYLYFRRMYCRTFVVNRRALRWSSRASDTVQVISVDDDDGSNGGHVSTRAATNDAVEWSPPISGSGFDEGPLPVGFANWSPHYCQARFHRLIPPPAAVTSLPELLDDEEATVDLTCDNSFRPRRQSSVINLLQPSSVVRELYITSTDDSAARDADYQRGIRKHDIGSNGSVKLDWVADDFPTDINKERATPF